MTDPRQLPADTTVVRTTNEFDETTVPSGLLRAHHIAADLWGVLHVRSGSLWFVFEGRPDEPARMIEAGGLQVIPPEVAHHVELVGPVRFVIEFHRAHASD